MAEISSSLPFDETSGNRERVSHRSTYAEYKRSLAVFVCVEYTIREISPEKNLPLSLVLSLFRKRKPHARHIFTRPRASNALARSHDVPVCQTPFLRFLCTCRAPSVIYCPLRRAIPPVAAPVKVSSLARSRPFVSPPARSAPRDRDLCSRAMVIICSGEFLLSRSVFAADVPRGTGSVPFFFFFLRRLSRAAGMRFPALGCSHRCSRGKRGNHRESSLAGSTVDCLPIEVQSTFCGT